MRIIIVVQLIPNLGNTLKRRKDVAVVLNAHLEGYGFAPGDLRIKHIHGLGGSHTELSQDGFRHRLAAWFDSGAKYRCFRYDTKGAYLCSFDKRRPG